MEDRIQRFYEDLDQFRRQEDYLISDTFLKDISYTIQKTIGKVKSALTQKMDHRKYPHLAEICFPLVCEQMEYVNCVGDFFYTTVELAALKRPGTNNIMMFFWEVWQRMVELDKKWTLSDLLCRLLRNLKCLDERVMRLDITRKTDKLMKAQLLAVRFMVNQLPKVTFDKELLVNKYYPDSRPGFVGPCSIEILTREWMLVSKWNVYSRSCITCGHCNNVAIGDEKMKKCSACKVVSYCSMSCQKKNWKIHKEDCKNAKLTEKEIEVMTEKFSCGMLVEEEEDKSVRCQICHKRNSSYRPLRKCSACKLVQYCSESCQRADWINHKLDCKGLPHTRNRPVVETEKVDCSKVDFNSNLVGKRKMINEIADILTRPVCKASQTVQSDNYCHFTIPAKYISVLAGKPITHFARRMDRIRYSLRTRVARKEVYAMAVRKVVGFLVERSREKQTKTVQLDNAKLKNETENGKTFKASQQHTKDKSVTTKQAVDENCGIAPRSKKKCWRCGIRKSQEIRLIWCPRCRQARYCSNTCLDDDRIEHKNDCEIAWQKHMSEVD